MSDQLRRYDMNLYKDRWMHFYRTTSPKHLFASDKQVSDAQQMIKNFEEDPNWLPAKYLWKAQEIVDAVSHPVTKELLFKPFSWAGFLPANVPILCGLIFTQRTTFNIIFWQWINQSYNSAVNYTYLNPNEPASYSSLLMSYIGAVSVSVFSGLKLSSLYQRNKHRLKEPIKSMARFSTPFIAVASAGIINLVITRAREGYNGLPLEDEFGAKVYKNSKTGQCVVSEIKEDGTEEYLNQLAGIRSVFQGAATRAFLPIAPIYLPPIMKEILLKFRMWPKSVTAAKLLEIGLITSVILYALPSSIAAFLPKATIPIQKLGPEFDELRKAGVTTLYFDRSI